MCNDTSFLLFRSYSASRPFIVYKQVFATLFLKFFTSASLTHCYGPAFLFRGVTAKIFLFGLSTCPIATEYRKKKYRGVTVISQSLVHRDEFVPNSTTDRIGRVCQSLWASSIRDYRNWTYFFLWKIFIKNTACRKLSTVGILDYNLEIPLCLWSSYQHSFFTCNSIMIYLVQNDYFHNRPY